MLKTTLIRPAPTPDLSFLRPGFSTNPVVGCETSSSKVVKTDAGSQTSGLLLPPYNSSYASTADYTILPTTAGKSAGCFLTTAAALGEFQAQRAVAYSYHVLSNQMLSRKSAHTTALARESSFKEYYFNFPVQQIPGKVQENTENMPLITALAADPTHQSLGRAFILFSRKLPCLVGATTPLWSTE